VSFKFIQRNACMVEEPYIMYKKFWEELIVHFSLIQHGPHKKRNNYGDTHRQQGDLIIFVTMVTFLPSRCLATIRGFLPIRCLAMMEGDTLSLIWHRSHWKQRIQQFFYCWVCIPYCGNVSSEPLPNNDKGGYTYTRTATWTHKPPLFFKIGK
jgi:hypothetical protein